MDRHSQVGSVTGSSEQLAERSSCHRREALGDEDIGGFRVTAQYLALVLDRREACVAPRARFAA
jgi:hypothetical protein